MAHVTFQVLDGADRGRVFANLSTPLTIGREEGNTIQLNDERVSRFHLKVQVDQDQVVLTDLESTNGTRVNGEETGLRILRFGDMIAIGRSVLVYGSKEQISGRLAELRRQQGGEPAPAGELDLAQYPPADISFKPDQPPELPGQLTPAQAAQLGELLTYLHVEIRSVLNTAREPGPDVITLETAEWQRLLALQAQVATYLRRIHEPSDLSAE